MNTPVNFELAKLLKEKEFHELTWQSYRTVENTDERLKWWKVGELNKPMYCKLSDSNDAFYGICSAPTIAEVVMWIYEKNRIWISVGGDCDYKFRFEIHTWKWYEIEKTYRLGHTVLGKSFWDISSEPYNSPTEAYEAAIEYCLNKLI